MEDEELLGEYYECSNEKVGQEINNTYIVMVVGQSNNVNINNIIELMI